MSDIQPPISAAGHNVTVWHTNTQGWPSIDTLWTWDAVFFHGSERRATGSYDSVLTEFAKLGGRLIMEGSNLASYGGAYPEFEKHAIHADWRQNKQTVYTNQVVQPTHPIAAGLPATFAASGYPGGSYPDLAVPAHGATLVIQYQNVPGSVAVCAVPVKRTWPDR
ncbi:MAG: hypothetical protein IPG71_13900 [bacterium]|nr:hypothetical protein [bacterium]